MNSCQFVKFVSLGSSSVLIRVHPWLSLFSVAAPLPCVLRVSAYSKPESFHRIRLFSRERLAGFVEIKTSLHVWFLIFGIRSQQLDCLLLAGCGLREITSLRVSRGKDF